MSQRTPKIFVQDILEAINKIERFTQGLTFKAFEQDELVIDGVLRNLEIIGEAARNIPDDIRDSYSSIPWTRMVGLRNIVVHAYFKVDLTIIWQIIRVNLPATKPLIESLLDDL